jgi:hypothetical protein
VLGPAEKIQHPKYARNERRIDKGDS